MREETVRFGKTKSLIGIITSHAAISHNNGFPGVILLNAGMIHRVGPSRLYVRIARRMASAGFIAFRFDFSGMGDSKACGKNLPFEESAVNEVQEAMDYLNSTMNKEEFILIGICTGADTAFKTACCDHRIVGAVMINGLYLKHFSFELMAYAENRTLERYYRTRIFDYRSWSRVILGKTDYKSIIRFLHLKLKSLLTRNGKKLPQKKVSNLEDLHQLIQRSVDLFLIYSEGSMTFDSYRAFLADDLNALRSTKHLDVEIIKDADHTFTFLWSQKFLIDLIHQWVSDKKRSWFTKQSIVTIK